MPTGTCLSYNSRNWQHSVRPVSLASANLNQTHRWQRLFVFFTYGGLNEKWEKKIWKIWRKVRRTFRRNWLWCSLVLFCRDVQHPPGWVVLAAPSEAADGPPKDDRKMFCHFFTDVPSYKSPFISWETFLDLDGWRWFCEVWQKLGFSIAWSKKQGHSNIGRHGKQWAYHPQACVFFWEAPYSLGVCVHSNPVSSLWVVESTNNHDRTWQNGRRRRRRRSRSLCLSIIYTYIYILYLCDLCVYIMYIYNIPSDQLNLYLRIRNISMPFGWCPWHEMEVPHGPASWPSRWPQHLLHPGGEAKWPQKWKVDSGWHMFIMFLFGAPFITFFETSFLLGSCLPLFSEILRSALPVSSDTFFYLFHCLMFLFLRALCLIPMFSRVISTVSLSSCSFGFPLFHTLFLRHFSSETVFFHLPSPSLLPRVPPSPFCDSASSFRCMFLVFCPSQSSMELSIRVFVSELEGSVPMNAVIIHPSGSSGSILRKNSKNKSITLPQQVPSALQRVPHLRQ